MLGSKVQGTMYGHLISILESSAKSQGSIYIKLEQRIFSVFLIISMVGPMIWVFVNLYLL